MKVFSLLQKSRLKSRDHSGQMMIYMMLTMGLLVSTAYTSIYLATLLSKSKVTGNLLDVISRVTGEIANSTQLDCNTNFVPGRTYDTAIAIGPVGARIAEVGMIFENLVQITDIQLVSINNGAPVPGDSLILSAVDITFQPIQAEYANREIQRRVYLMTRSGVDPDGIAGPLVPEIARCGGSASFFAACDQANNDFQQEINPAAPGFYGPNPVPASIASKFPLTAQTCTYPNYFHTRFYAFCQKAARTGSQTFIDICTAIGFIL